MKAFLAFVANMFEQHFAVMVLASMFFGGAFLLAHYNLYEEMSRWIEGGPTVVALVAILKAQNGVNGNGSTPPEVKP